MCFITAGPITKLFGRHGLRTEVTGHIGSAAVCLVNSCPPARHTKHGGSGGRRRGDGIGDERTEAIERDGIAIARVWSGPIYPPHPCVCA